MAERRWIIANLLLIFTPFISRSYATCDSNVQVPIVFPVRNVTLAGQHVRRGVEIQVGSPPQSLAVTLDAFDNNTYLYDTSGQCGSLAEAACSTIRGGPFDETQSSSWQSLGNFSELRKLDPAESSRDNWLAGNDFLTINSSLRLPNYPIGIPRDDSIGYKSLNQLGMGPSSALLTGLQNLGAIASRSWSLFWGRTGLTPLQYLDGSLVLGGLDAAKAVGQNYTTSISSNRQVCDSGLLIDITDISLELPNGTSVSIIGTQAGTVVGTCVKPDFEIIMIRQTMWNAWLQAHPSSDFYTRKPGNPNLWGLLYDPQNVFNGDLKFTIDNQLSITVPNSQLVQYALSPDTNGDLVANSSVVELMINPLEDVNANDMPTLGVTFLQAAYLHVNYDRNTFTLWQANPTTDESFVGIGASAQGCKVNSSSTGRGSSISNGSQTPTNPATNSNSGLGGGMIGVIVAVAVIATAGVIGGLIFFWLRRRRQAKSLSSKPARWSKAELDSKSLPAAPRATFHELPTEPHEFQNRFRPSETVEAP